MYLTVIPLRPSPSQEFSITLDGVPVVISIRWNATSASYVIDIEEATGAWALRGLRMAPGVDLLSGHARPELGVLAISSFVADDEPTYEGLGTTHRLYYYPRSAL